MKDGTLTQGEGLRLLQRYGLPASVSKVYTGDVAPKKQEGLL